MRAHPDLEWQRELFDACGRIMQKLMLHAAAGYRQGPRHRLGGGLPTGVDVRPRRGGGSDVPSAAATRPSRLDATLATKYGRPVRRWCRYGASNKVAARAPSPTSTAMPAVPQPLDAGAGHAPVGVLDRDDDAPDAGGDERVGTRTGAAVVGAGLERDVRGRAAAPVTGRVQRFDLGVRAARRLRRALADDDTVPHEDTTDPRVRRGTPAGARPRAPAPDPWPDLPAGAPVSSFGVSSFVVASGTIPRFSDRGGDRRRRRHRRVARATAVVIVVLSHPDSDRRPRTRTWSAHDWRPCVRGLPRAATRGRNSWSPPVGTSTQPRGLLFGFVVCFGSRAQTGTRLPGVCPRIQICNVFQFWRAAGRRRPDRTPDWCDVRPGVRFAGERQDDDRGAARGRARPAGAGARLDQGVALGRARRRRPGVVPPAGRGVRRDVLAARRRDARRGARQLLPPRVRAPARGAARARSSRCTARARPSSRSSATSRAAGTRATSTCRTASTCSTSGAAPTAVPSPSAARCSRSTPPKPVDVDAIAAWVRGRVAPVCDIRRPWRSHLSPKPRVSGGGRRRGGRARAGRSAGSPRGPRSRRPTSRAGCRSTPRPACPATARDSIPKPRPPASLARRIASTSPGASRSMTARVPSGVRSRGPKPVPPVVTHEAGEAVGEIAQRLRRRCRRRRRRRGARRR